MAKPEVKLRKFEDYYGKIDYTNLLQVPNDLEKIAKLTSLDRLFEVYISKQKELVVTNDFQIEVTPLGYFATEKPYRYGPEVIEEIRLPLN